MPRVFVMIALAALSCGCTDRSADQPSARAAAPAQREEPPAPQAPAPPAPPPREEAPPESPPRPKTPSPPETDADRACQESDACRWTGLCHSREGRCVALTDRDCEASRWCAYDGSCSVTEDRRCGAIDDADCARLCYEKGQCSIEARVCVAGSSADCEGPCARSGRCLLRESTVSGGVERSIDESRPDAECVVWADTDCSQTRACRDEGLCELAVARTHHGSPVEYECARERSHESRYLNIRQRRLLKRAAQE